MAQYNSNIELAQEISARIGNEPIPFESVHDICMEIYQDLGGDIEEFDDVYSILLEILPLAEQGGRGLIDDTVISSNKTWSSNKINSELSNKQGALTAGENIDITNNTISAKGYKFNGDTNGGFAEKYKQDAADGGQVVENTATGLGSHAEGYSTTASGDYGCHAEGNLTQATGYVTHAEGNLTKASETASHAEGGETEAKANYSHAEGYQTKAIGRQSHSEGGYTKAKGLRAHAEGEGASADNLCAVGDDSHTEGLFTQTQNYAEHAQGAANVSHKTASNAATTWQGDGNHTLHSIGNGRYTDTQSNAVEVMQNADVYIKGVGGYDGVHIKSEAGYETVKTLQQVIGGKQDVLTAGQNIVITNNTISAVIDAGFHIEVVQTLPATGEVNTIYFVPKTGGANPDVYDEYMYINNAWEKIGSTEVDLSNYYNKTEVDTLLSGKQATLTAGNNITINGTTISANDTTYSAGTNITIVNNRITAEGYTYNPATGAFTDGDRDIADSGTTRPKPTATGVMAHAEGSNTKAIGRSSHAEGNGGSATGIQSHTEGSEGNAIGTNSHVEGRQAVTNGYASHAEGAITETGGNYASATTNPKTADSRTDAGDYAHAEGNATIAYGYDSHAEGRKTFAKGSQSHAEGSNTNAIGIASHSEGSVTNALAVASHAEGRTTKVNSTAYASHTEGYATETGGNYTTNNKEAGTESGAGAYAHAEGNATIANCIAAHSEGVKTLAKGTASHAEGYNNVTNGNQSHVEGANNVLNGNNAHCEGVWNVLNGVNSHAEGRYNKTLCNVEHAQGSYNVSHHVNDYFDGNVGNTLHSIGIGTADNARKNAVEVMQSGQVYLIGVGNYDGIHIKGETGAPSGLQTLQEVVRGKQDALTAGDNIYINNNNTISALGYDYDADYESIVTGFGGIAYGNYSHAEGQECMIGYDATASHAEGVGTETNNINEHAQGRYNVSHSVDATITQHEGNTVVSVGIGEDGGRKNAFEIMQNGDIYVYGVGYYDGTATKYDNPDVMTLQDILKKIADETGTDIGALI